jgi:putative salt-induced outer membrane protein YdiY
MRALHGAIDPCMITVEYKMELSMILKRTLWVIVAVILAAPIGLAQVTANFPNLYTGSFGGGLALTGGNTDTRNFNLSFEMVRDPLKKNVTKAKAAYLRGAQNKTTNLDRAAIGLRDEYTLSGRLFGFGQLDYLRDRFKSIDFIWNPTAGLGYKIFNSDRTKLEVSGGAGGILEKDVPLDAKKSGSVVAGETFRYKLSSNASLSESHSTIWKTEDFADSLSNFSIGITTSVAKKLEVKSEFNDSFKNRPVSLAVKKNDTAFITTFLVKF